MLRTSHKTLSSLISPPPSPLSLSSSSFRSSHYDPIHLSTASWTVGCNGECDTGNFIVEKCSLMSGEISNSWEKSPLVKTLCVSVIRVPDDLVIIPFSFSPLSLSHSLIISNDGRGGRHWKNGWSVKKDMQLCQWKHWFCNNGIRYSFSLVMNLRTNEQFITHFYMQPIALLLHDSFSMSHSNSRHANSPRFT